MSKTRELIEMQEQHFDHVQRCFDELREDRDASDLEIDEMKRTIAALRQNVKDLVERCKVYDTELQATTEVLTKLWFSPGMPGDVAAKEQETTYKNVMRQMEQAKISEEN